MGLNIHRFIFTILLLMGMSVHPSSAVEDTSHANAISAAGHKLDLTQEEKDWLRSLS